MIVIDSTIPAPPIGLGRNQYPWALMKVGDSFLVADEAKAASARVCALLQSRRDGRQFIARRTPDGLRIWRIA